MSALLTIDGLQLRFGERLLIDIEHLDIAPSSAYVLTGANGSGKSSLLRILCGLQAARIESAYFMGKPVTLSPYPAPLRDAILYVHQHPVMFSTTVEANVGYGLAARGVAKAALRQRVAEAMEWAGILHLHGTQPQHWSGGEKQRVALARARVLQPQLLLLDEPTANLDGPAREQVIGLIPTLLAEGRSVIMACHDRDLIGLPGVRRLKLKDGRLTMREPAMRND
ncbi:energy-coupling factor ABC transporter ATP-binding protein [Actimicrobium sp. CCI2.3]|uniref:energy-coupling factor ABC transporter ATP-binding protein n=1 Tax=Actimicrobium sp. CCI2.3 TaxID=3048616 RepID=UPI002AB4E699|nr:energy-coupling factor ABC transporter ATP-binding protein [Actimicrobium sp. CCI2.3]MDY7575736.1 energy-coupling factor ABC transporter ATP-binding protein [Actimicrobium sp. CCI2.3]MEB0023775.1 energy-coupling factor ABC transporter ATP-binding protein [Actimicrobium sp. CCI2.3]